MSILCHAEIDGERLDDESIIQESLLILIGGDETSRHVMTDGMLALFAAPRSARDPTRRSRGDRRSVSRSCCGGCRRSRTCRARSRATWSCTARRCAPATRSSSCIRRPTATRGVRRARPVRRAPRPEPAPRVRVRPALLHGRVARAARAHRMFSELLRRLPDLHLAGDPLPAPLVELHLRVRRPCPSGSRRADPCVSGVRPAPAAARVPG